MRRQSSGKLPNDGALVQGREGPDKFLLSLVTVTFLLQPNAQGLCWGYQVRGIPSVSCTSPFVTPAMSILFILFHNREML